jgi:hypothetical protein
MASRVGRWALDRAEKAVMVDERWKVESSGYELGSLLRPCEAPRQFVETLPDVVSGRTGWADDVDDRGRAARRRHFGATAAGLKRPNQPLARLTVRFFTTSQ